MAITRSGPGLARVIMEMAMPVHNPSPIKGSRISRLQAKASAAGLSYFGLSAGSGYGIKVRKAAEVD